VAAMSNLREQLFSIHNHSDGHIALYLEEQDAVKDLLEDVAGNFSINALDELQAVVNKSVKVENYFNDLDAARENIGEGAPLLCRMTEEEALILAEDLIRAVKFGRISREAKLNHPLLSNPYPALKAVKW
jgi:hypothetical protein